VCGACCDRVDARTQRFFLYFLFFDFLFYFFVSRWVEYFSDERVRGQAKIAQLRQLVRAGIIPNRRPEVCVCVCVCVCVWWWCCVYCVCSNIFFFNVNTGHTTLCLFVAMDVVDTAWAALDVPLVVTFGVFFEFFLLHFCVFLCV